MNKPMSILIIILSWIVGIKTNDCTFAAVITLFLLPEVFERNRKRDGEGVKTNVGL